MSVLQIEREDDLAWITIENPPVNATSLAVRQGLLDAVAQVQDARLAILRCAGRTFIAGGDMSEFDAAPQEPHLPDVVAAIEASKAPFVAVMHGTVLGGGLEIAMGCAFRIASPETRFGLPEVNVGLIPGAGGTQRAPRLFGWEAAFGMACSGKLLSAQDCLTLGAIDSITADPDAFIRTHDMSRPVPISKRAAPLLDPDWVAEKKQTLANKPSGQTAPLHNLEALEWAALPFEVGQAKERALHLQLRESNESQSLRHAFFAERAVTRPKDIPDGNAKEIKRVAVIGGGLMGAGIAASFLTAGVRVTVIERDDVMAKAAQDRVHNLIDGALLRGKIDQSTRETQVAAFTATVGYDGARDADLALEAVFEDVAVKSQVFQSLLPIMRDDAIFATNTSYLDPNEIFDGIAYPGRCIGLHFFSPAHIMKLIEVVRLPATSPDTLATAFSLAKRLRKTAVMSGICDGFIGNRMLAAYRRAAEYMLADGALPQQIDAAMRAFGMAMGPFETQDMSGLQIAQANRRRQSATRPATERYVTISDQLCDLGRFGRRVRKGWYRYVDADRQPQIDPTVTDLIKQYADDNGISRQVFTQDQIQIQLLAILANEGACIVEEGIAESDAAVDVVKLHGYGFPRWRGGPMFAAQSAGRDAIARALDAVEAQSPGSWTRAKRYQ